MSNAQGTHGARRRAGAGALVAVIALVAVATFQATRQGPRPAVLTYWAGADADEPGYAEEAANQIEDGTYAAHVGWWERPGYWNNRAVSDQGESEMDARMFADAASRKNWETAGTDFWDADSLYSESEDSDSDQDMMGAEFDNSWPGTGANIYDWQDMAEDSDGYDGQWPMQPLDLEAADDAAVSQNDLAGYKAIGGARLQTLAECDACDAGSDCVSGCRARQHAHDTERHGAMKHRIRGIHFQKSFRAAHRAAMKDAQELRELRPRDEAGKEARRQKDDNEMADLERILHPKNRFQAQKLVDKVIGQSARGHKSQKGKRKASGATRQMKRMSSLSSSGDDEDGDGASDDEEYREQEPGEGWFLGCDPGPGFSSCLRESVRETSRELTPELKPFYNKRQQNPGCTPGPGFSACMVDNLDLDQPNYQADGYWPVTKDDNTEWMQDDEGVNVDKWWDSQADAGASILTFTPRRDSQSADPGYAMKAGNTQSLHFVAGVGLVEGHRGARHGGSSSRPADASWPAPARAVGKGVKSGDEGKALSAADGALASASRQLGREAAQRKQLRKQQHRRAEKLALLRKLQGKKVVRALDANKAVSKKQEEALLVQELHRQLNDKNFKPSGYLPLDGNSKRLRHMGINVNGQQLKFDMNFKRKGYWPVTGNRKKLERLGVKVCGAPLLGTSLVVAALALAAVLPSPSSVLALAFCACVVT